MAGSSFKQSLLLGSAIATAFLLIFSFVFMAFQMRQSDIARSHSILAQRVVLGADWDRDIKERAVSQSLPPTSERSAVTRLDPLVALNLLDQGGSLAGKNVPRIENPEISLLLKSLITLRQARENTEPESTSSSSLTLLFREKAQTLSDALTFRAITAGSQVWIAFWLMVSLVVVLLLASFFGGRILWVKERRRRREDHALGLANELLMALPEAVILLDKTLSFKFVNSFAERFFGCLSEPRQARYFDRFCADQSLLADLRDSFTRVAASSPVKIISEAKEVVLRFAEERPFSVNIKWYQLSLVDQNYLLGVIYDFEEDRRKGLDLEVAQGRLQEFSRNFFKAQDDERRHLADELHDGLCQSLAVLKMQVSGVERRIEEVELQDECRKARQFIAQIIEDVRRLSHDLSPVILDDLGLSGALAHLVNNFTALHNLKASVAVADIDGCFNGDAARNIYRIVQEAINNVGKHAEASLVVLAAEVSGDAVYFSIKDDGVGFEVEDPKRGRAGASLGLASMAQRAHLLEGEFEVISQPGKGTEVKFKLPKK